MLGTLATTCAISLATAVLSTIGGAVMAWIVARTDFRHKTLVTTLTGLSFCFPGFILAMAWIIIGSPGGLINGLLGDGLGWTWPKLDIYSAVGIVWIQVLHITPFTYLLACARRSRPWTPASRRRPTWRAPRPGRRRAR